MSGLAVQFSQYPSRNFFAGVESDTAILPPTTRGFYVVTDGNLVVDNHSDVEVTLAVLAGMHVPIAAKRLKVATTATVVVLA